jgi:glutamine cyclotransferase
MNRICLRLVFVFGLLVSCPFLVGQTSQAQVPAEYTFTLIRAFHHDTSAYTQGLAYRDGFLYEGTGLNGHSSLRKTNPETGSVLQSIDLQPEFFGEGITIVGDKIVQLTWKSQTGFVYDLKNFHLLQQFSYSGEGWGLATNSRELFMSDGTSEIRVLDTETFREKRRFKVHDGSKPIDQLNELEFVEGQIFANVWHTNRIARISPQTGAVVGWIDLTGLLSPVYHLEPEAVLNGIAYDPIRKRLFVTGKLWPTVFEIRLSLKQHK